MPCAVADCLQSFWILVSVISGMIFFGEYTDIFADRSPALAPMFPLGVAFTIGGVYILSQRTAEKAHQGAVVPDVEALSDVQPLHPSASHLSPPRSPSSFSMYASTLRRSPLASPSSAVVSAGPVTGDTEQDRTSAHTSDRSPRSVTVSVAPVAGTPTSKSQRNSQFSFKLPLSSISITNHQSLTPRTPLVHNALYLLWLVFVSSFMLHWRSVQSE